MSSNSYESGYSSTGEDYSQVQPEPNQQRIKHDQKRLESEFAIDKLLMNSANGRIYSGHIQATGQAIILKQIPRDNPIAWARLDGHIIPAEIFYHFKAAGFDNDDVIVRPITWLEKKSSFVLVMERIENSCDLFDLIKRYGALAEGAVACILSQMAKMVVCLERAGICHRDIKDENIIVDLTTLQVKLIDFGCATSSSDQVQADFSGTPEFYPPEYYLRRRYNQSTLTMWSCGVVLFIMLNGRLPVRTVDQISSFHIHTDSSFTGTNDQLLKKLLSGLLHPIPTQRLTTESFVKLTEQWQLSL